MVIVVIGVSGSGKTAVGSELAARLGWAFEDADDFHAATNVDKMRRGVPLTDQDRIPWIRSLGRAVGEWSADGRDVVLACSALRKCHRDALRAAVPDGGRIRFVHLKGSYETIDRRLRLRSSEALAVDIEPPVAAIVASILAGLHLDRPA
ncbi:MAG: gluconokinase [Deltaproteobacteria bacterium]|nr:MAG: gluconokinase [Deltaproteobacteria bacterium]